MDFLNYVDLNQNEIRNAVIQQLGTDPASPINGQVWVNTTSWTLKVRLNGVTVTLGRLDQIAAPTGSVALNAQRITGLADPAADQDAATRAWVLSQINSRDYRESIRAASLANVSISSPGASIGGVTAANGERFGLFGQSTSSQNGIYIFNGSGSAMTRATDAASSADVTSGLTVFCEEGTSAGRTFQLTTANPITLGSTSLTFVAIGAGAGTVNKYSVNVGDGAATDYTVTHNFGTQDVIVIVRLAGSPYTVVYAAVEATTSNTVTVSFATAPTTNQFRVTVLA